MILLAGTDLAVSADGRFLYALDAGTHAFSGFQIGHDGGLTAVGTTTGLLPGTVGLVSR